MSIQTESKVNNSIFSPLIETDFDLRNRRNANLSHYGRHSWQPTM